MDICMVLEVTPEQLLTGKGIDDDNVEYMPKKVKTEPEISKTDIRIIEDIHAMKDAQRKRLMKYMAYRQNRHIIAVHPVRMQERNYVP